MKRVLWLFVIVLVLSALSVFIYGSDRIAAEEEYVCCECMEGDGTSTRQWVRRAWCEERETCNIIYLDHDQCHN